MIVVNHEKFLSARFDLVIRWYFLEKTDFDARKARILAESKQHIDLRDVFATLLTIDVAKIPHSANKVRRAKVLKNDYGSHVAHQLFHMLNWSWIDKRMSKGEKWIKKNPYPVMTNGLGLSAKRFILALKHERHLYWEFKERGKIPLNLWNQSRYREMLESHRYSGIEEAGHRMVARMGKLGFFSVETYLGEKELFNSSVRGRLDVLI